MAESGIVQSAPKRHLLTGTKQSPEHVAKRIASFLKTRASWSDEKKAKFRETARQNATRANLSEESQRAARHKNSQSRQRIATRTILIYGLFDPRDGTLRYVGKTARSLDVRQSRHLQEARAGTPTHLYNWWRLLGNLGLKPEIAEIDTVQAGSDWVEAEQFWIAYFRFVGCDLLNVSIGGQGAEGYSFTKEHRAKLSAAHMGQETSAELREKRSVISKAAWEKNPQSRWKPENLPEITAIRAERRAAGLYKTRAPASEETKMKISLAKRGKLLSPEHKAKLSLLRTGKKLSPAHCASISKARRAFESGKVRKPL